MRLLLRDALRSAPALEHEYQDLKRQPLRELASDRPAYTDAKSAFVAQVLAERPKRRRNVFLCRQQ